MPRLSKTRRLVIWFYIVSLSLGVILIFMGTLYSKEVYGSIATALGSAIIGAVLSLLFADLVQAEPLDLIYKELVNHAGILSDEEALRHYRKPLHHYHVTSIDGKRLWRHRIYDFSRARDPGRLEAYTEALDAAGLTRPYRIQAGIRGDRLIVFDKAQDRDEAVTIEVYPTITTPAGQYAGIGVMQAWDGAKLITRCLLSEAPIAGINAEGDVPDTKWQDLQSTWDQRTTGEHIDVLPKT